jgi:putative oxidoreductase
LNGIMLMKNVRLAGAYIILATFSPGTFLVDARRRVPVAFAA